MNPFERGARAPQLATIDVPLRDRPVVQSPVPSARILLIDETTLTRECLVHMLRQNAAHCITDSVARLEDAPSERPDIVLLNIRAARVDDRAVLHQVADIRRRLEDAPLVIIADLDDSRLAMLAIRQHLRGYLPTSLTARMLAAAIGLVLAGGTFIPDRLIADYAVATAVAQPPATAGLTSREAEVLALLRQGKPNKLIGFDLAISESTVKVHIRHIMRKLRATNRTQLALHAEDSSRLPV